MPSTRNETWKQISQNGNLHILDEHTSIDGMPIVRKGADIMKIIENNYHYRFPEDFTVYEAVQYDVFRAGS